MPGNAQLGEREHVKVFVELGTRRILGIAPANCKLLGAYGVKYTEETLVHARDIEMWIARLGEQTRRDAEISTVRQIQRESKFRQAIRAKLLERNKHVNKYNQDLTNAFIKLMDQKYDRMLKAKMNPVTHGLAQAQEQSKSRDNEVLDFAAASPAYKNPGDMRASGSAVSPEMAKIEHDKRA